MQLSSQAPEGKQVFNGHFTAHYSYDMKHAIGARWLANPIHTRSHFPPKFRVHINILLNIKMKILFSHYMII